MSEAAANFPIWEIWTLPYRRVERLAREEKRRLSTSELANAGRSISDLFSAKSDQQLLEQLERVGRIEAQRRRCPTRRVVLWHGVAKAEDRVLKGF